MIKSCHILQTRQSYQSFSVDKTFFVSHKVLQRSFHKTVDRCLQFIQDEARYVFIFDTTIHSVLILNESFENFLEICILQTSNTLTCSMFKKFVLHWVDISLYLLLCCLFFLNNLLHKLQIILRCCFQMLCSADRMRFILVLSQHVDKSFECKFLFKHTQAVKSARYW